MGDIRSYKFALELAEPQEVEHLKDHHSCSGYCFRIRLPVLPFDRRNHCFDHHSRDLDHARTPSHDLAHGHLGVRARGR